MTVDSGIGEGWDRDLKRRDGSGVMGCTVEKGDPNEMRVMVGGRSYELGMGRF